MAEDRFVTTSDGEHIALTHHATGHPHVLILCPGFWQHRRTRLFRALAERLAPLTDVVAMDFRGHGQSSGRCTFTARETRDLLAVLQDVRPRYPHVSVVGFSLGAVAALDAAVQQRGIDRLVLVSPPMAFEHIENQWWTPRAMAAWTRKRSWGWTLRLGSLWLSKPRPLELIARLAATPVLIVHGTHDDIVRMRHGIALHQVAGGPKRLEIMPGGLHAELLFGDDPEGFVRLIDGWCRPGAIDFARATR